MGTEEELEVRQQGLFGILSKVCTKIDNLGDGGQGFGRGSTGLQGDSGRDLSKWATGRGEDFDEVAEYNIGTGVAAAETELGRKNQ